MPVTWLTCQMARVLQRGVGVNGCWMCGATRCGLEVFVPSRLGGISRWTGQKGFSQLSSSPLTRVVSHTICLLTQSHDVGVPGAIPGAFRSNHHRILNEHIHL